MLEWAHFKCVYAVYSSEVASSNNDEEFTGKVSILSCLSLLGLGSVYPPMKGNLGAVYWS